MKKRLIFYITSLLLSVSSMAQKTTIDIDGTRYFVGENLITNPSFSMNPAENENKITGWTIGDAYKQMYTTEGGGNFLWFTEGGHDGGAYIQANTNTGSSGDGSIAQRWTIRSGKKYYLSFWLAKNSPNNQYIPVISLTNELSEKGGEHEDAANGGKTILGKSDGSLGFANYDNGEWCQTTITFDSEEYTYLQFNARWLRGNDTQTCFDDFYLAELLPLSADTYAFHLNNPGTLADSIPDGETDRVVNLILSGTINGDDITFIKSLPNLKNLDIEKAAIKYERGKITIEESEPMQFNFTVESKVEEEKDEAINEGSDITYMIKNAGFELAGGEGWVGADRITNPHGGSADNYCAEAYNQNFDVYQDVTGLPNGVYKVSFQAFYRSAGNATAWAGRESDVVLSEVYFNDFTTPVKNVMSIEYDENLANNCWETPNGTYTLDGMAGASAAFSLDDESMNFTQHIYGLVTDGTMRLGIRQTENSAAQSSRWTLWDNFKLTYMDKNEVALADVIASLTKTANSLLEEIMSATDKQTLQTAIDAAQNAQGADAMYDALITLNNSIKTVKVSTDIENGFYYLKNVESGMYLTAGNSWDTQASLGKHGIDFYITKSDNKYTIDSQINGWWSSSAYHFLDSNGYIDGLSTPLTIKKTEDNLYIISYDDANILSSNDNNTIVDYKTISTSDPHALWELIPKSKMQSMLSNASTTNPIDATFLIKGSQFFPHDTRNEAWQGDPTYGGYYLENNNVCAEKYSCNFDVYQILTNIPNGIYEVGVQCFYRGGSADEATEAYINKKDILHPLFYANNVSTPVKSICEEIGKKGMPDENTQYATLAETTLGSVPNNMYAAGYAFRNNLYNHKIKVEVTDNSLRVGIKNESYIDNDWTIFDNFELTYLGKNTSVTPTGTNIVATAGDPGVIVLTFDEDVSAGVNYNCTEKILVKNAEGNVVLELTNNAVEIDYALDLNQLVMKAEITEPGEYTIEFPAGLFYIDDFGSVESTAVTVTYVVEGEPVPEIADGTYYLKNVETGMYLTAGNSWGTQASLGAHGLDVVLTALENGKYTIASNVFNGENHYLGSNGYVDSDLTEWAFTKVEDGVYNITLDGVNYIGYDGSTSVMALNLTDPTAKAAQWQLVTKEELLAGMAAATGYNPVDATFLISGQNFSRNDSRNDAWQGAPSIGGASENNCAEKWNCTFDIYQTLTDLPNGVYELSVQGFYRNGGNAEASASHNDGTEALNALLYANEATTPLMSVYAESKEAAEGGWKTSTAAGYVPNSMSDASAVFSAGAYADNKVRVVVKDGTLTIGVKKDVEVGNDWAIFDNFELTYLGEDTIYIEIPEQAGSTANTLQFFRLTIDKGTGIAKGSNSNDTSVKLINKADNSIAASGKTVIKSNNTVDIILDKPISTAGTYSLELAAGELNFIDDNISTFSFNYLFSDMQKLEQISLCSNMSRIGIYTFHNCPNLLVVNWNNSFTITASHFDSPSVTGNLLIYAPAGTKSTYSGGNVVIGGQAKSITLTDKKPFRCPAAFKAKSVSYSRSFSKTTTPNVPGGWETIVLPFDVKTITNEEKGSLAPFNSGDTGSHPFWLAELTNRGFSYTTSMKANCPYIIAMPNSDEYAEEFNIRGDVIFSASDATNGVTVESTQIAQTSKGPKFELVPIYETEAQGDAVYAINNESYNNMQPGSVFVRNSRDVPSFEPFARSLSNIVSSPLYYSIGGNMGEADGIERLYHKTFDGTEVYSVEGVLYINSPRDQTLGLYSADGRLVRLMHLSEGMNKEYGLGSGIYFIGKMKVVVK